MWVVTCCLLGGYGSAVVCAVFGWRVGAVCLGPLAGLAVWASSPVRDLAGAAGLAWCVVVVVFSVWRAWYVRSVW
jgi:hypothetical protein